MTVLRTLIVGSTDIRSLTGVIVTRLDLLAPATRRGSNDVIPGRQGQLGAQLPYDAYQFAAAVTVEGTSEADVLANLRAVGNILYGTNGLMTLYRHLPNASGGTDVHSCDGQFVGGLAFDFLNLTTAQTELTFLNLSGAWWDGSTWLVP